MLTAIKPGPGGALDRSFRSRPADPVWASASMVKRVNDRLRAFDPYLALWWSPMRGHGKTPDMPGRWRVVRWMFGAGQHHTVFYWEGPSGEYRSPDPVAPILDRLKRADRALRDVDRELDAENESRAAKRKASTREALREFTDDYGRRRFGNRQTFGSGSIRSRKFLSERPDTASPEHAKLLFDMGLITAAQAIARGARL